MKNTKDVKSIDRELLDLELDDTDEPSPSGRQPRSATHRRHSSR